MKKLLQALKIAWMIYRHADVSSIMEALAEAGYHWMYTANWYMNLVENSIYTSHEMKRDGTVIITIHGKRG